MIVYVDVEGECEGKGESGPTGITTAVETITVVTSGTADCLLVVTDVEDGVDKMETGEDGKGELVERDAEYEDADAGNENV